MTKNLHIVIMNVVMYAKCLKLDYRLAKHSSITCHAYFAQVKQCCDLCYDEH